MVFNFNNTDFLKFQVEPNCTCKLILIFKCTTLLKVKRNGDLHFLSYGTPGDKYIFYRYKYIFFCISAAVGKVHNNVIKAQDITLGVLV